SIAIPAQNERPELRSRALLLATMQVGNTGNAGTVAAALNTTLPMTRVVRIDNTDSGILGGVTAEIWVLFDEDIGNLAAGTYNVNYSLTSGSFTNTPAICALVVEGIAQAMPVPAGTVGSPAAAGGPVNGSISSVIESGFLTTTTEISAQSNNSLIFSVAANNRDTD